MSISPSPFEPGSAFRELDTQLRQLLQDLIDDTEFFAFPFEDMDDPVLPITCHIDRRTAPAITTNASLDAAVSTVGDMLQEPRFVELTRCGPGSWTRFFDSATCRILKAANLSSRFGFEGHPFDSLLTTGGMTKCDPDTGDVFRCWEVDTLVKSPGHWSCIMWDTTVWYDSGRDSSALYGFRSELLACVALLSRQLEQRQGTDGVHEGSLKATIVTFAPDGARVLQASCDPLASSPVLALTFRGSYGRTDPTTGYSTESACNIVRWIVQPDDPGPPVPEDVHRSVITPYTGKVTVNHTVNRDSETRETFMAASEASVKSKISVAG